jgi:hypothetical protein
MAQINIQMDIIAIASRCIIVLCIVLFEMGVIMGLIKIASFVNAYGRKYAKQFDESWFIPIILFIDKIFIIVMLIGLCFMELKMFTNL